MEQNKIVFFSDLDDTLIFSKRKIDFSKNIITAGYNKQNEAFSYIYKETKILLDNLIDSGVIFIPNTARNLNSYKRTIFYKEYNLDYVILNFGGLILFKNKPLQEWEKIIQPKLSKIDFYKIIEELSKQFEFEIEIKLIDGYYISVYNRFYRDDLKKIKDIEKVIQSFGENYNFNFYLNKNSFALYPKFISKEVATKFLIKKLNPSLILGAGDSNADKNFLKLAHIKILPFKNSFKI